MIYLYLIARIYLFAIPVNALCSAAGNTKDAS
jgi:uncharacterized BrkB/YihY/UPF0761 family membrane protein